MIKPKRQVNKLIIHCSATKPDMNIGVKEIRVWHLKQGWAEIGYHFVIRRDGTLEIGRDIERIGSHVKGHNTGSIGICMVGGVDDSMKAQNNFTAAQWLTLERFVRDFERMYPDGTIHGHREFDSGKECPSFDVKKWLAKIGIV